MHIRFDMTSGQETDVDPELYQILQEAIDLDESIERLEGSIGAEKWKDQHSS